MVVKMNAEVYVSEKNSPKLMLPGTNIEYIYCMTHIKEFKMEYNGNILKRNFNGNLKTEALHYAIFQ